MQIRTSALAVAALAALAACDEAVAPAVTPEPTMALPALPAEPTDWAVLQQRFGDMALNLADPDANPWATADDLPDSGKTTFAGLIELPGGLLAPTIYGDMAMSTLWASGATTGHAGNFSNSDGRVDGELTGQGSFRPQSDDGPYVLTLPMEGSLTVPDHDPADVAFELSGTLSVRDGALAVVTVPNDVAQAVLVARPAGD